MSEPEPEWKAEIFETEGWWFRWRVEISQYGSDGSSQKDPGIHLAWSEAQVRRVAARLLRRHQMKEHHRYLVTLEELERPRVGGQVRGKGDSPRVPPTPRGPNPGKRTS